MIGLYCITSFLHLFHVFTRTVITTVELSADMDTSKVPETSSSTSSSFYSSSSSSHSSASESASGDDLCSQGRPWLRRYGRHQLRHRCCHSFRPSGPRLLGKERLLESRTEQHNVQLRSKVDLMSKPTKWSRRRL